MSTNTKAGIVDKIATIHQVEGFDPAPLAVEYVDLNSGNESRKRLPVMAQLAWFRLRYPEGKISATATLVNDHYVAHAKVYRNFADSPEHFLAEATASRTFDSNNPSVSPREWAQTAAIGIALRNAGFGLQFHAAGDRFDQAAVDEVGALQSESDSESSAPVPEGTDRPNPDSTVQTETEQVIPAEVSPEDAFKAALNTPCPIAKFSDKTLGDLLREGNLDALVWVAEKFIKDPAIAAAAKLICDKSLELEETA